MRSAVVTNKENNENNTYANDFDGVVTTSDIGEFEVFCTTDKDLLEQYYKLRHDSYRNDHGWVEYDGSENDFDRHGHIIVAVSNNKVIGGIRLMFSNEYKYLSNEIPGTQFEYVKFIRKYDERWEDLVLAEISALVVHKDYRDNVVVRELIDKVLHMSDDNSCHYVFAVATVVSCRNYRMNARSSGYDSEIVMSYPWKEKKVYGFVRMFPMYCKLR